MEINYKHIHMCLILLNIQLIINMLCYVFGNPRLIWNKGTTLLYGEVIMSCNAYS